MVLTRNPGPRRTSAGALDMEVTMGQSPDDMFGDEDYPAYTMGRAAEIIGTTPDFLRSLDEAKLIEPHRSGGGHRRYSRYQLRLAARARETGRRRHRPGRRLPHHRPGRPTRGGPPPQPTRRFPPLTSPHRPEQPAAPRDAAQTGGRTPVNPVVGGSGLRRPFGIELAGRAGLACLAKHARLSRCRSAKTHFVLS